MSFINPDNTIFVMLSFEGPDVYSQAGGLGVRCTELSRSLAEVGFETHLFFIGDPDLPSIEYKIDGRLCLHRWCQWISAMNRAGVYEDENGKRYDFQNSIPPFLLKSIVSPAAIKNKLIVVLAEEWHTAQTVINLHNLLKTFGLRDRVAIFWNANNTYGFWNIDWWELRAACTITTVSRYMKHLMFDYRVNPMIIPNGIPRRLLEPIDERGIRLLRSIYENEFFLIKVGRYSPDKRWIMAIDSVADLRMSGNRVNFLMRGGMEPHRADIYRRAREHALDIRELKISNPSFDNVAKALYDNRDADLIELNFFVPEEFLRYLYASADAALANSGHEPFGLVGLEVMATGGIPFVGASGEDYAMGFQNSIVVETDDPKEISSYLLYLDGNPQIQERIRSRARLTAEMFTWDRVLEDLLGKIEFIMRVYGRL